MDHNILLVPPFAFSNGFALQLWTAFSISSLSLARDYRTQFDYCCQSKSCLKLAHCSTNFLVPKETAWRRWQSRLKAANNKMHALSAVLFLSLALLLSLSLYGSLASRLRSATRRKPVALVVVSYASHLTPRRSFETPSSQSQSLSSQRLIEKCFVCEKWKVVARIELLLPRKTKQNTRQRENKWIRSIGK